MRPEKKSIVNLIKEKLDGNTMFILTDYSGLSASQMNELRAQLREKRADFMVVKKRLFKRALGDDIDPIIEEGLLGPTAVALGSGDCAVFSKVIVDFAKKNEAPQVKAGLFDGAVMSAAQIGTIASLPPREVLIALFMGGLKGSLSGFVGILREMIRQFVSVMDQIGKQRSDD